MTDKEKVIEGFLRFVNDEPLTVVGLQQICAIQTNIINDIEVFGANVLYTNNQEKAQIKMLMKKALRNNVNRLNILTTLTRAQLN